MKTELKVGDIVVLVTDEGKSYYKQTRMVIERIKEDKAHCIYEDGHRREIYPLEILIIATPCPPPSSLKPKSPFRG